MSSRSNNKINILFLGEAGVGKSTFINAFANYLKYDSLREAIKGKPEILIPASFTVMNSNYGEQVISYGKIDKNECNESDQTKTLFCKSYEFDFDDYLVTIIDTPGIGGTQSNEVNMRNFKNIISFISHLECLNAICILLKANDPKITTEFKFCFKKLLSQLDKTASRNVIFVLTHSRSTIYRLGQTMPLLKEMLEQFRRSLSTVDIELNYKTIYCFNNESFIFLILASNNIKFIKEEVEEFENSWKESTVECFKLLRRIIGDFDSDESDHTQKSHDHKFVAEISRFAQRVNSGNSTTMWNYQTFQMSSRNSFTCFPNQNLNSDNRNQFNYKKPNPINESELEKMFRKFGVNRKKESVSESDKEVRNYKRKDNKYRKLETESDNNSSKEDENDKRKKKNKYRSKKHDYDLETESYSDYESEQINNKRNKLRHDEISGGQLVNITKLKHQLKKKKSLIDKYNQVQNSHENFAHDSKGEGTNLKRQTDRLDIFKNIKHHLNNQEMDLSLEKKARLKFEEKLTIQHIINQQKEELKDNEVGRKKELIFFEQNEIRKTMQLMIEKEKHLYDLKSKLLTVYTESIKDVAIVHKEILLTQQRVLDNLIKLKNIQCNRFKC